MQSVISQECLCGNVGALSQLVGLGIWEKAAVEKVTSSVECKTMRIIEYINEDQIK